MASSLEHTKPMDQNVHTISEAKDRPAVGRKRMPLASVTLMVSPEGSPDGNKRIVYFENVQ